MSSRQEGCRQCRLVGKLMTGLGVARLTGRHHQHLPWLDLADPACCPVVGIDLEIRLFDAQRHPAPMAPMQFTVLTIASASASSTSPCRGSITAVYRTFLLMVPPAGTVTTLVPCLLRTVPV